jgi:hypothetical protein
VVFELAVSTTALHLAVKELSETSPEMTLILFV